MVDFGGVRNSVGCRHVGPLDPSTITFSGLCFGAAADVLLTCPVTQWRDSPRLTRRHFPPQVVTIGGRFIRQHRLTIDVDCQGELEALLEC